MDKEKIKMKSRKLGIALLLMLALVVTSGTFAYWASSVTGNADTASATVTIGTGNAVTTTVVVAGSDDTSALVPTNYIVTAGDDTVSFTMPVNWSGTGATGATGTIVVTHALSFTDSTPAAVTGTDLTAITALFSVTITPDTDNVIVAGTSKDVVVQVVFMTEPGTLALYNLVQSGVLSVDLTFTVTAD